MTQSGTATIVRQQVVVNAPIDEAFKVFTERFGDFKPREHNLLQAPIAETVFEPRSAATSMTARPMVPSADGRGFWPSSPRTA